MLLLADRPNLLVDEIDPGDLPALAREWAGLVARCPWATPFQLPEWLLPWLERFRPSTPWLVTVRDRGRLAALAPLFVYRDGGVRTVALLGAGVTDRLDLLVDGALVGPCVEALLAHLARHAERWQVLDFEQQGPASPLLAAPCPEGWTDEVTAQDACPALEIPPGAHDLTAFVPGTQRRRLRYFRGLAARHGGVRLVIARDEAERAELFRELVRLHGVRWQTRGGPGMLEAPAVERFLGDVSVAMMRAETLRLWGLRQGDAVIAVVCGFALRDWLCLYLSGFDPAYRRLSPGTLLLGAVLEEAARTGVRTVDFLRGREPYKYWWGARDVVNRRRRLRR